MKIVEWNNAARVGRIPSDNSVVVTHRKNSSGVRTQYEFGGKLWLNSVA